MKVFKKPSQARISLHEEAERTKQGKGLFKPEFVKLLSYADSDLSFELIADTMMFRDIRFFSYRINDADLINFKKFLEVREFTNLSEVQNNLSKTNNRISEIETGEFFEIPVVNIHISLLQFIILGGLINLIIIFYFWREFNRTDHFWRNYILLLKENERPDKKIYFYDWTFGLNNRILFILIYSLDISFISITSLLFELITFKYSIIEIIFISGIALVNYVFALIISSKYYKIQLQKMS